MPAIFGDHMVLQQAAKLPVWGWAAPGETVTVAFAGQKATTVAGDDGSWRVDLKPVDPSGEAAVLTVSGKNTLVFTDVLVGDVWIASGQSNMEFGLQTDSRGTNAIASANDPKIRLFFVPWATALKPQTDIRRGTPPSPLNGQWQVCRPETLRADWGWHGFSAVGYYFARDIREVTGNPVGMIATYKGGTPAESWTSVSGLEKNPALGHYVTEHEKIVDNYAAAQAAYPGRQAEFRSAQKKWKAADEKARAAGKPLPEASAPRPPPAPDGGFGAPGDLFNGMVAPLIPYAIKGVIWYQGEGNANSTTQACEYATLFPRMISDWREKWDQGDFPFLYVQLPNINRAAREPSEGKWPWLRESQLKTLSLPNTGMAVTIDIGEAENLHPPDKLYVGKRLALAARHLAYDEQQVCSGPIYDSMSVEGNKIRLKFKNVGGGLKLGTPPPTAAGKTLPPPTELTGFGIAGADQKFVWARAVIDGNTVLVFTDTVSLPVAVRYDWGQNPPGDLYNQEGLPASPFRTDNWPPPL